MKIYSLVVLIITCFSFKAFPQPVISTNVDDVISKMSLEDKVGQLFLIGVNGDEFNSINQEKLEKLRPGGIILFGRNIKSAQQVSQLLFDFQSAAAKLSLPPLFTAVDQEGGNVTRLKHWPPIPSAAAVGRTGDLSLAYKLALFTGQILSTLGFNMNLAPVLDLARHDRKSFVGSRSFGNDPAQVAKFGAAVITGLESAGIFAVAKHFPGHGGATADSHLGTPVVQSSYAELLSHDLFPFQRLTAAHRINGLMVAHISFPQIEKSFLPATYSKTFLTDYLRTSLNYEGLVFTDDLEMLGALGIKDPAERAIRAVAAGADTIMVAWNPASQKRAYYGLIQAVKKGRISEQRINASLKRILIVKEKFAIPPAALPSQKELETLVYHRELESSIDQVVMKNIFRSLGGGNSPLLSLKKRAVLISSDERFSSSFGSALSKSLAPIQKVLIPTTNDVLAFSHELSSLAESSSLIYYAKNSHDLRILRSLAPTLKSQISVITPELPGAVHLASGFKSVLYTYTRHPELGALVLKSLIYQKSLIARESRELANINSNNSEEGSGSKNYK